jgi:hypothetical protein
MVARWFDRCQVAIDIDAGRARGTAPTGYCYLTISNITPIVNVMFLISSAVLDRESLHSRQE